MRIIYISIIVCFLLPYCAVADDAPVELVEFHQLKDAASKAYRDENWQLSFDTANKALALRPLHPSINALLIRTAQKLGDEEAVLDAQSRLDAQGLDFIRPIKNLPPVGDAKTYYTASKAGRLPESLAVFNENTFIGYLADRVIKSDDAALTLDKYGSPLGMAADSANNRLWVSTGYLAQTDLPDGETKGVASLLEVDLETLDIVNSYPSRDEALVFGSVAVNDAGTVFVSDSASAGLFALRDGEIVKVAGHSGKGSFQAIAPMGNRVYVADYTNGIYLHDVKSGKSGYLKNMSNFSLITIDGLAPYKDNQLIAIQNGLWPQRVLRLFIDGDTISCAEILTSGLPEFDEPTNGVVQGNEFIFIANSQWPKFSDPDNLPEADALNPAHIMAIDLEKAPSICLVN